MGGYLLGSCGGDDAARKMAKVTKVLGALSAYSKAEWYYQHKFKRYGTLVELKAADLLDAKVADATAPTGPGYSGYYFTEPMEFAGSQEKSWYQFIAAPQHPQPGDMMFLINQPYKIWQKAATAPPTTMRVPDPAVAGWTRTG